MPHKSWNVWNRDNREKVLKDEREHREKEDANALKNNKLLQEQNLDILRGDDALDKCESAAIVPFRLFDEIEKNGLSATTNDEYMKEKDTKDKRTKQQDGTAAWGLGEGSREMSKSKPWYESMGSTTDRNQLSEREMQRKINADPMSCFNAKSYNTKKVVNKPVNDSIIPIAKKRSKRSSEEKESHHKKKKQSDSSSAATMDYALAGLHAERDAVLAELQKRMRGEVSQPVCGAERATTSRWTERDEQSTVGDNRYSQQYNPTIAKHIRAH